MRHWPGKANASGIVLNAAPDCHGFMLAPGVPPRLDGNASQLLVPGSFPVRVKPRTSGADVLRVSNSHAFYFASLFPGFDIYDCDPGDCWDVYTFDSREEGVMLASGKGAVPVTIQDTPVALATPGPPTLATDGWPLRPSLQKFTVFFSGTARTNRLWVRQLNGTWFDTGIDYLGADLMAQLVVDVPGDRWTLIANGAAQLVHIEGRFEVG